MRTFVVHENRPDQMLGLKLCLLSLARHQPDDRVVVYAPESAQDFSAWVRHRLPRNELRASDGMSAKGWNIKPALLLAELHDGVSEVSWLDADILVARPLEEMLSAHAEDALIVASDHARAPEQGTGSRTLAWGLSVGNLLPQVANTGFIRAQQRHVQLLERWEQMLNTQEYLSAQERPGHLRPLHHLGDQEALTALLGSTLALTAVVSMLAQGVEIAQCEGISGFALLERVRSMVRGGPFLIHAMGLPKPWHDDPLQVVGSGGFKERRLRGKIGVRLRSGHARMSPYSCLASRYAEELPGESTWLDSLPQVSRVMASPVRSVIPEMPLVLLILLLNSILTVKVSARRTWRFRGEANG